MSQSMDRFLIKPIEKDPLLRLNFVESNIRYLNNLTREVPFSTYVHHFGAFGEGGEITHVSRKMDDVFKTGAIFGTSKENKKFVKAFGYAEESIAKIAGFFSPRLVADSTKYLEKTAIVNQYGNTPGQSIFINLGIATKPSHMTKTLYHEIGHAASSTHGIFNIGKKTELDSARILLKELADSGKGIDSETITSIMKKTLGVYAMEEGRAEQFSYEHLNRVIGAGQKIDLESIKPSYLDTEHWDEYINIIKKNLGEFDEIKYLDPEIAEVAKMHAIGIVHGHTKMVSGEVGQHVGRRADIAVRGVFASMQATHGMEVLTGYKKVAREASDSVQRGGYRVVFSDTLMPVMGKISENILEHAADPISIHSAEESAEFLGRQTGHLLEVASQASHAVASGARGSRVLRTAGAALSILRRRI